MDEKHEPLSDEVLLLKELHLFFSDSDTNHRARHELSKHSPVTEPFIPISTAHLHEALQKLVNEGLIDTKALFLDVGSGDGRVLAFASCKGIPTAGVEINQRLVHVSREKMKELHKRKLFSSLPAVLHGDALSDETYASIGGFAKVRTFFLNKTLEEEIIEKVMKHSKLGTRVVLYDVADENFHPEMKVLARFTVSGQGKHIYDYLSRPELTVKVFEK